MRTEETKRFFKALNNFSCGGRSSEALEQKQQKERKRSCLRKSKKKNTRDKKDTKNTTTMAETTFV